MTASLDTVRAAAASLGLTVDLQEPKDAEPRIVVSRKADDWSVEPQAIAIGRTGLEDRAMTALREMAPRLQKVLANVPQDEERLAISAGIASDGTVTTLRVERDGTVRLSPEDIEAIAEAVYRRMKGRAR